MTKHDPLGLIPYVEKEEERRKLLAEVEKNAYALNSSKDDARKTAMGVEEQKRAQDEARKREIMDVEPDVSRDILRVARTIDQIVNNEVFSTEIKIECPGKTRIEEYEPEIRNYTAQVTVKDGRLELRIGHKNNDRRVRWDDSYKEEALFGINTKKDKIEVYYNVREWSYSGNGQGVYRISRWTRKSPKAFRFLAEDAVKKNNPVYINDFIDMYKAVPEILAAAIRQMKKEQEAKKQQLEREAARLEGRTTDFVEQIKAYEPDRTSQAEEPKQFKKKGYIEDEITDQAIRDIGEEIGLYSTSRKRRR